MALAPLRQQNMPHGRTNSQRVLIERRRILLLRRALLDPQGLTRCYSPPVAGMQVPMHRVCVCVPPVAGGLDRFQCVDEPSKTQSAFGTSRVSGVSAVSSIVHSAIVAAPATLAACGWPIVHSAIVSAPATLAACGWLPSSTSIHEAVSPAAETERRDDEADMPVLQNKVIEKKVRVKPLDNWLRNFKMYGDFMFI